VDVEREVVDRALVVVVLGEPARFDHFVQRSTWVLKVV